MRDEERGTRDQHAKDCYEGLDENAFIHVEIASSRTVPSPLVRKIVTFHLYTSADDLARLDVENSKRRSAHTHQIIDHTHTPHQLASHTSHPTLHFLDQQHSCYRHGRRRRL